MNIFKLFDKKYRHFKQKYNAIERTIWDLQFKRFKTREIREEIRQTYDMAKSRLSITETNLKTETPNKAQLEDEKVILERDIARYEQQLQALDNEINGAPPSSENPDGINGITAQIESFEELKLMVRDYM